KPMKKQWLYLTNNDGFYFPMVLVVTAFVMIFLGTFIYLYQNELLLSEQTIQQIEAETFIQMSRTEFIQEVKDGLAPFGEVEYTYPNGEVNIQYTQQEHSNWLIDCIIDMKGYKESIQIQYTIFID